MRPSGIITLTTDFGLADAYVGVVKGVILGINPRAVIVDITHDVRPQRVEQAAFLLANALPYFPPGTVHLAVVDPGVGTPRRALALATPSAVLVGPDNDLLSAALPDAARPAAGAQVALPPGYRAFHLTNQAYFRHPVSSTFHGRDIFAPVAAYLSRGLDPSHLGEEVATIQSLPPFAAMTLADGSLHGRVVHIDRFGNLVTDVRADQLSPAATVKIAGRKLPRVRRTYQEGEGLLAVLGSS
ncbi:MAG: S-adenosyl-l-methionine hydroxide adenosyltransferase family protein, partial [Dehalococcoidia bacterium]